MDYQQILYQVEDGVGLVTLNRPQKLNAMTAQMGAELGDVMAEADGEIHPLEARLLTAFEHKWGLTDDPD